MDSTPLGKNTNKRTASPSDSITIGGKLPEPTPLTLPTDFKKNGKAHVSGYPDQDPSWSESSSKIYNFSNDRYSSKSNKIKRNEKGKRQ